MSVRLLSKSYSSPPVIYQNWPSHRSPAAAQSLHGAALDRLLTPPNIEMLSHDRTCWNGNDLDLGTLEPKMILRYTDVFPNESPISDSDIDTSPSAYCYLSPSSDHAYDQVDASPEDLFFPEPNHSPPLPSETDGDPPYRQPGTEEMGADKPYAKLIWEALMQAPGHRMMLRDIYDWFIKNTTKPQESGTNGWQNSIRHNLSMNHAFENDKGSPSRRCHSSRKANSVWVLTDNAVKHGVQSTTRYRKPSGNRKGEVNRPSTHQRQKWGTRRGRTMAKGAVRPGTRQEMSRRSEECSPTDTLSLYRLSDPPLDEETTGCSPECEYQPTTPPVENPFESLYALPTLSHASDIEQLLKAESDDLVYDDAQLRQFFSYPSTPSELDPTFRLGMD